LEGLLLLLLFDLLATDPFKARLGADKCWQATVIC